MRNYANDVLYDEKSLHPLRMHGTVVGSANYKSIYDRSCAKIVFFILHNFTPNFTIASSNRENCVRGFQYELERTISLPPEFEDDESIGYEDAPILSRLDRDSVSEWCECDNCINMPSETECVCCQEIDAIKCFRLNGELRIRRVHPSLSIAVRSPGIEVEVEYYL